MLRSHMCIIILFICMKSLGVEYYDGIPYLEEPPEDPGSSEFFIDPSPQHFETPDEMKPNDANISVTVRHARQPVRYLITLENCISYFSGWNAHDVLRQYHLYKYKPFREYIQMLPEFSEFIIDLHDRMEHALGKEGLLWTKTRCKPHRKQLDRETNGYASWVKAHIDSLAEVAREYKRDQEQTRLRRQQELQRQRKEQERREQEQRRQREEQQEIKSYGSTLDDCISAWSEPTSDILRDVYHSRVEAARQLKIDDSSSDYEYAVTPQAVELLHNLELDVGEFQTLHGNVLQHTLHSEFVSMVENLAPQYQSYCHIDEIADMHHLAIKASDIGRQYNASGDISNASYIADACWHIVYGLQEATIGAGEGVVQGVSNTGHMIAHPVATVQNIGYGVAWLINGVITNSKDACTLLFGDDGSANIAWDSLCGRVRHVKNVLEYLRDNASIRNVTREATSLVVEGYLQHKMIHTLADFYNNAHRYAAQLAEYAPCYEEEALLETAEGVYVEIADEAAQTARLRQECTLFQMEHDVSKSPNKQILQDIAPGEYEPFNFEPTAAQRMYDPDRLIPLYILDDIIRDPVHVRPDPKGLSNAYMYYSRIWKNGKLYNVEVLYERYTNTISHFLYRQKELGPLDKVKQ